MSSESPSAGHGFLSASHRSESSPPRLSASAQTEANAFQGRGSIGRLAFRFRPASHQPPSAVEDRGVEAGERANASATSIGSLRPRSAIRWSSPSVAMGWTGERESRFNPSLIFQETGRSSDPLGSRDNEHQGLFLIPAGPATGNVTTIREKVHSEWPDPGKPVRSECQGCGGCYLKKGQVRVAGLSRLYSRHDTPQVSLRLGASGRSLPIATIPYLRTSLPSNVKGSVAGLLGEWAPNQLLH